MSRFQPYRKRKSYTLAIFLILLAVILSFASPYYIRPVFTAIIYPFQLAAVSLWKGITNVPVFFVNLRNLSREYASLKKELEGLKPKAALLEELVKENTRLREDLNFRERNPYNLKLLAAQVIGKSPSAWFSILEVNQGARVGVKINMPVIDKSGLVGRVIEVSPFSSKILLIIDEDSSVAAINSRSRDFGLVKGAWGNRLFMRYVSAGGDVKEGDAIVASPISTLFPPGFPIGKVRSVAKREHDLFYDIEIQPAVDFSKLEEVFVVF